MNVFVKDLAGAVGREVVVMVASTFLPRESDLSDRSNPKYVFAYHIEIENRGAQSVKLISRHWWIIDGHDRVKEVEGQGVVGQQPVIPPGETFSYSSFCVVGTPTGRMRGIYSMLAEGGGLIEVPIPQFTLRSANDVN